MAFDRRSFLLGGAATLGAAAVVQTVISGLDRQKPAASDGLVSSYLAATPIPVAERTITPAIGAAYGVSVSSGAGVDRAPYLPDDARFQPLSGTPFTANVAPFYKPQWVSTNSAERLEVGGPGFGHAFTTTGQILDVCGFFFKGLDHQIRLKVDGAWADQQAFLVTGDDAGHWITWDFGDARTRQVELYYGAGIAVSGYDSSGDIGAAAKPGLRAVLFGDSYAYGIDRTNGYGTCKDNLAGALSEKFGLLDFVPSGVRGQGWVKSDPDFAMRLGDRAVADITRLNPDIVFMFGSVNDADQDPTAIRDAVRIGLAQVQNAVRDARIVFISGFSSIGIPVSDDRRMAAFAGATAAADRDRTLVVDALAARFPTVTSEGGDTIHPSPRECVQLAENIGPLVATWLARS